MSGHNIFEKTKDTFIKSLFYYPILFFLFYFIIYLGNLFIFKADDIKLSGEEAFLYIVLVVVQDTVYSFFFTK